MSSLVSELFEEQARTNPDAQALFCSAGSFSYRELDSRANQLARHLQASGVSHGAFVQILLPRSVELIATILAVLKCGAAYVPLDPAYPGERLTFLLEDLKASLVVTTKELQSRLPAGAQGVVCIEDIESHLSNCSSAPLDPTSGSNRTAVLLYTSGSTGHPKGVLLAHGGLVNYLLWERSHYGHGKADRILQQCSIAFDFAQWEIFTALANGGCLVLPRPLLHYEGSYLVDLIQRERVSVMGTSPSLLSLLIEVPGFEKCSSLCKVFAGGEILSHELQTRFFARSAARLFNIYGPTETTISVTHWECGRESNDTVVPIGFPIANAQVLLLDAEGTPVSDGSEGEIYIGGPGVGPGYYNRPDLNRERFVEVPFTPGTGAKHYRTGDRARRLRSGAFEYLGRQDDQVKLNGQRIELEEVESALRKCSGVKESVVRVTKPSRGNRKLAAYYVPTTGDKPSQGSLRSELRTKLPQYMIPSVFLEMDRLPLTPNGKIDRENLPSPEMLLGGPIEGPATEAERIIAGIWTRVLGIRSPDVTANFFELGGDSLACLELSLRIEEQTQTRFPLSLTFEACTIREQAERVEAGRTQEQVVSCVPVARGRKGITLVLVSYPGGGLDRFSNLAEHLPNTHILGMTSLLNPPRLKGEDPIQTIAQLQLDALLNAAPQGQLILAGFSTGGVIALEIAHRLRKLGRPVRTVVLLDIPSPDTLGQILQRGMYGRLRDALLVFARRDWGGRRELLQEYLSRARRRIQIEYHNRLSRRRATRASRNLGDGPPHAGTRPGRGGRSVDDALYEMVRPYRVPQYDGHVVLIRARDQSMAAFRDPTLGWSTFIPKTLEVRTVPGNHNSMVRKQFVGHVASILRELLAAEPKAGTDSPPGFLATSDGAKGKGSIRVSPERPLDKL